MLLGPLPKRNCLLKRGSSFGRHFDLFGSGVRTGHKFKKPVANEDVQISRERCPLDLNGPGELGDRHGISRRDHCENRELCIF